VTDMHTELLENLNFNGQATPHLGAHMGYMKIQMWWHTRCCYVWLRALCQTLLLSYCSNTSDIPTFYCISAIVTQHIKSDVLLYLVTLATYFSCYPPIIRPTRNSNFKVHSTSFSNGIPLFTLKDCKLRKF